MSQVIFDRNGESGNIFWVMGAARRVLKLEGRKQDAVAMQNKVLAQNSYEDALGVIAEFVDLIDVSGGEYDGCQD